MSLTRTRTCSVPVRPSEQGFEMSVKHSSYCNFLSIPEDLEEKIDAAVGPLNSAGFDPWGLHPETLKKSVSFGLWFYRNYFRVKTYGLENLPKGKAMVVANHSGQLPFDGFMLALALLIDAEPARIPRGMMDYWVPSLPFISDIFSRSGAVVGSPLNCLDLLAADQCIMVFPEGTRGLGKPYSKRYQLQNFGSGFMRLAIEGRAPIVPVGIIGAEDLYPGAFNIKLLAKLFGTPYFPVTPLVAMLGPLGTLPLPIQITIRFGKPLTFTGDPDMTDNEISPLVKQVKDLIQAEISDGLRQSGSGLFGRHSEVTSKQKNRSTGGT